jgi:subtilisin family serine protease
VALPTLPPAAAPGSFPATSSQEFLNNWGPGGINVENAWRYQNAHGEGVLIGVIDDGIDPNHPELIGRVDTVNSRDMVAGRNALTTTLSHGSELASLMVGNFNGSQTVGVAYQATVLAVRADDGSGGFLDDTLANALNYAVANGVDVVNFSLGGTSPTNTNLRNAIQAATAAGVILVFSAGNSGPGATSPNFPAQLAASSAISNGLILVAGGSNPDGTFNTRSNQAGAASNQYLVAPGWEIIVPDHGPAGAVPGFQSCGAAAGIAADLCEIQGTSYASPHVAAAVAVLKSAFPGLTPAEVVQIILQSTDDMGAAGIDTQTGWGHLNLERAFGPLGTMSSPLAMASGAEVGPTQTLGAVGAAFGDGVTRHSAAWTVAAFDSFGRTYDVNFSDNWARASAGPGAIVEAPSLWRAERVQGTRVEMAFAEDVAPESYRTAIDRAELEQAATRIDAALGAGLSVSFAGHGARATSGEMGEPLGHLSFVQSQTSLRLTQQVNDVVSLSMISESGGEFAGFGGVRNERSANAARASLDFGRFGFDVTAGRMDEAAGVLGFAWSSDIAPTPGGATEFAGVSGHFIPADGWRLSFSAEHGIADLPQSGWLSVDQSLRTSAYAFEASRWVTPAWLDLYGDEGEGVLSLNIAQPLRVEDGAMSFMAPTATNYGRRSLTFERRTFEPTPSGRETRVALGYRYFAGDLFSAFGEIVYVSEPGHVLKADAEGVARFGFRVRR